MSRIIEIAFFLSLITTTLILFFGIGTYLVGGKVNERYSNKAMRWRITSQAITLLLFFALLLTKR
ncbi:MAG: twin transmembrane helix small protein [Alphaproteobacteria bacterium]|nr:twin transmembrane helix small protein [Alphaproteobacteria bacterium]